MANTTSSIVAIVGSIVAAAAVVILTASLGTIFGAIGGFLVGILFEAPIMDFIGRFVNVDGIGLWQVGMSLGFIGGFFRVSVNSNTAKAKE